MNEGADINAVNEHKETPLYIMIKYLDRSSVNILLPVMIKGANPNLGEAVPLVKAAKRNFDVITKLLLAQGAEIDKKNQHGHSALMATLKTPSYYQEGELHSMLCVYFLVFSEMFYNTQTHMV